MATTLRQVLEEAQGHGFLGPGPVGDHIDHARAFVVAIGEAPARLLDLGSGGGVPGLVLALAWPDSEVTLLDSQLRRVRFLQDAAERLGIAAQVHPIHGRAEDLGREPDWRAHFPVVTARAFARPAVTAECARPFLAAGGRLLVAEPPTPEPGRWPADGLAELGFRDDGLTGTDGASVRRFEALGPCPDRFPRRAGIPAKRPLFA
jgi:16S rRNA (guanine527-N7)-methyltransferase